MDGWTIEWSNGPAADLHHRELPDPISPVVWIHQVDRPALVLGSAQPSDVVDRDRACDDGVEICRRRSGGGLVALIPGHDCWIDVVLPRSSSLWSDDVGHAFGWVGRVWARAITDIVADTVGPIEVHEGPLEGRTAGRVICFAGLGPGEVTVGGHKVVGLSQRRTRSGARFQGAMTWRWDPDFLARYVDPIHLRAARIELDALPVGLPDPDAIASPSVVAERFVEHLPALGPS